MRAGLQVKYTSAVASATASAPSVPIATEVASASPPSSETASAEETAVEPSLASELANACPHMLSIVANEGALTVAEPEPVELAVA